MQNQLLGLSKETKKKAGIEVTPPDYEPNAAMVERDPTETNDNNIDDGDFT